MSQGAAARRMHSAPIRNVLHLVLHVASWDVVKGVVGEGVKRCSESPHQNVLGINTVVDLCCIIHGLVLWRQGDGVS